jgi:hypothetical protein
VTNAATTCTGAPWPRADCASPFAALQRLTERRAACATAPTGRLQPTAIRHGGWREGATPSGPLLYEPLSWAYRRRPALSCQGKQDGSVTDVLASATRLLETGGSRGLSSSVSTLTTDCSMSGVIPDPLGVERKCGSPSVTTGPQPEKRGATRVTAELDGATPASRLLWSAQANVHLNRRQHEQADAS